MKKGYYVATSPTSAWYSATYSKKAEVVLSIDKINEFFINERKNQNLTQKQFAEKSNLCLATIKKIESGALNFHLTTAIRAAMALGYTMSLRSGSLHLFKMEENEDVF